MLELLTQLSRSLLILLLPQVVCLVGLQEGCLGVKGFDDLILSLSLDELLESLLVESLV